MILVIGGPPGSGKTTVAERWSKVRGYALVSAGMRFRAMAKERGLSLEELGRLAEADPEIDRSLDRAVYEEIESNASNGRNVVVDGRIQAYLLAQRHVECLKVLIDAPLGVRAERIAGREGKSVKVATKEVKERERSERTRYAKVYGIDVRDTSIFDIVADSSDKTPDAVVRIIEERVATWEK